MKIWIDLTNSPHINFFKPFVRRWKEEGHQVLITTRDLANTIDLIEQNNWEYNIVGGHAGKSKLKKIIYFPLRVRLLRRFLKKNKPDIGISHSSFYSPIVARLTKIPAIYLNDNEHAKGNHIAFKFATLNLLPEFLREKALSFDWGNKYKIDFYPGIKEGVYLSQSNLPSIKTERTEEYIYIRPEPWTAQYYSGESHFMDTFLMQLKEKYKLVILPRNKEQLAHYRSSSFKGIRILEKPIPLEEIHQSCLLFIGAGGSMTREFAFLGKPTISIYQDELLEVDKYLIEHHYMLHSKNPTVSFIEKVLKKETPIDNTSLLQKGKKAFAMIDQKVKSLA